MALVTSVTHLTRYLKEVRLFIQCTVGGMDINAGSERYDMLCLLLPPQGQHQLQEERAVREQLLQTMGEQQNLMDVLSTVSPCVVLFCFFLPSSISPPCLLQGSPHCVYIKMLSGRTHLRISWFLVGVCESFYSEFSVVRHRKCVTGTIVASEISHLVT